MSVSWRERSSKVGGGSGGMSLGSWVGRIQGTGWEFRMEHVSLLVVGISSEMYKPEAEHVPAALTGGEIQG